MRKSNSRNPINMKLSTKRVLCVCHIKLCAFDSVTYLDTTVSHFR